MDNELHPANNFKQTGEWPDPTPEMLDSILFDTIWRTIKSWDVNVPHAYSGYMGATGNHARAIYDAVLPLVTRTPSRNDVLEEAALIADELGGVREKSLDNAEFSRQHVRAKTIAAAIRARKDQEHG